MCGIAGFVRDVALPDGRDTLERMRLAVAHRGPDASGAWQSPGGQCGFAHTRLSILDPSPAGNQPMSAADGRLTITYNGEIYNFADLRRSLTQSGVTFRSNSDTEVILRLYEREGDRCVERLRGMFAFAIWDQQERTCFLARDRFGIKPLYYSRIGDGLLFASEVRALLASGLVSPELNPHALYRYFRSGSVPEPLTLIEGIRAVEAGQSMTWRAGRESLARYWEVKFPDAESESDYVAATRRALIDSVRHHFVSDVPVGVFLSGGMDSTALVALAREVKADDLQTFSLSFPGTTLDEGPSARRTAELFGTSHHELAVDASLARPAFDDFLAAADQPSIDGFNTFIVSRLARRHGIKVVLSGVGGDELFGGYPSFRNVPRLLRRAQLARLGGPVGTAMVRLAGAIGGPRLRRINDLMTGPLDLEAAYSVLRGIYTDDEARRLAEHHSGSAVVTDRATRDPLPADPTPEDTISRLEITRYMRNQLLRDTDVMSMASGVELRVPFLDPVLFDTVARIPARQRLQPGKDLLRRAVPEIPEWVANQPKRGFLFPFEDWLAGTWGDAFASIDRTSPVPAGTWYRKWAVLAFERWRDQIGRPAPHGTALGAGATNG